MISLSPSPTRSLSHAPTRFRTLRHNYFHHGPAQGGRGPTSTTCAAIELPQGQLVSGFISTTRLTMQMV